MFFNLLVGCTGVASCILVGIFAVLSAAAIGELIDVPDGPLVAVFGIIFYGILANVCYTFGWISELIVRMAFGPEAAGKHALRAFRFGIQFSVLLTLVPAVIVFINLVMELVTGHKIQETTDEAACGKTCLFLLRELEASQWVSPVQLLLRSFFSHRKASTTSDDVLKTFRRASMRIVSECYITDFETGLTFEVSGAATRASSTEVCVEIAGVRAKETIHLQRADGEIRYRHNAGMCLYHCTRDIEAPPDLGEC